MNITPNFILVCDLWDWSRCQILIRTTRCSDAHSRSSGDLRPAQALVAQLYDLLSVKDDSWPSDCFTCGHRSGLASLDRLRPFLVLHLREPRLNRPQQLAHGRVDRAGVGFDGNNGHSKIGEFVNSGDHFPHITAQARDFPNEKAIELPQSSIPLHLLEKRTALGTLAARSTLFNVDAEVREFGDDSRVYGVNGTVTDGFLVDATGKQLSDLVPIASRPVPLGYLE